MENSNISELFSEFKYKDRVLYQFLSRLNKEFMAEV